LEIKEAILRETLQRIGRVHVEAPIATLSGPDLAYRFRASFHVNKRKLGFMAEGSHTIVRFWDVAPSPPKLNAFIAEANEILATPAMAETREVHVVSDTPCSPHSIESAWVKVRLA
jgi:tRNA/tmRNA/rRNA uracil-C5-methylase (TrmA/RlmC/RlmD family)